MENLYFSTLPIKKFQLIIYTSLKYSHFNGARKDMAIFFAFPELYYLFYNYSLVLIRIVNFCSTADVNNGNVIIVSGNRWTYIN